MARLEVQRALDVEARQQVYRLVAEVQAVTGHRPLSDHLWLDLVDGGRHGFAAVFAWHKDDLVGYCQLSRGNDSWALELVLGRELAERELETGTALVARALEVVAASGGGHAHWWVFEPTAVSEQIAATNGLAEGRTLYQMRVALPLPDSVAGAARGVETRPFERGRDEDAWIAVNNAAFAAHPEQGGWDRATLQQRELQPWFDPAGFRLHEREGRLAAFCWTKIHAETDPVLGEIYVIAVHPDFAGTGLGKALTVAGLDHLAERGITTGMLYVDRDNTAAVGLYERLGFTVHRTDRAYIGDIAPLGDADGAGELQGDRA